MKRIPLSVLAGGIFGVLYLAVTVAIVAIHSSITGEEPFLFFLINPHTSFVLMSVAGFPRLFIPVFTVPLSVILNFGLGCGIVGLVRKIRRRA